MSHRFEPLSLRERSQVIRAITEVQGHKPEHGEHQGRIRCPRCGSGLSFTILSNGISRGQCAAAGCVRWSQ